MAQTRITITIPGELVEAADRKAREQARSRSWVLVEALKAYLTDASGLATAVGTTAQAPGPGVGPSRQAQLEADFALTPEERVRLAEQTAMVAELRGRRSRRDQVLVFDRLEDFQAWEKHEALAP